MKVDTSISSTNATLDASNIHEEAIPSVSALVTCFSSAIQSLGNAIEDLYEDSEIEDGRRKAMMALVLKMEILSETLGSQSKVLEQLRCNEVSPLEAGFPEFEHTSY